MPHPDPYTATREQFTRYLVDFPIPEDAAQDWKDQATNLKDLVSKLAYHEAMAPNLQQTYMTPANSKNKIYFMWDFVGRTLVSSPEYNPYGMLYNIDPKLPRRTSREREAWSDIISRNVMGGNLLLDTKPGMLDMMVESTYPNQSGPRPVIGEEILETARKLANP